MRRKVRFKVYDIKNKKNDQEAGAENNFEGKMFHKVIVFVCKTQKQQQEIL